MFKVKILKNGEIVHEADFDTPCSISIGRGNECDIILDPEPGISRNHLTLSLLEENIKITKNSSTGKVIVKGENINEVNLDYTDTEIFVSPFSIIVEREYNDLEEDLFDSLEEENPIPIEDHFSDEEVLDHEEHVEELSEEIVYEEEISDSLPPNITNELNTEDNPHNPFEENEIEATAVGVDLSLESFFKVFIENEYKEDVKLEGSSWIFGRDKESDFTIKSGNSSRKHFQIFYKDNLHYIKDLGSANGTKLNGKKIPANQDIEIKSGDIISASDHKFIFELRDSDFNALALTPPDTEDELSSSLINQNVGVIDLSIKSKKTTSNKKVRFIRLGAIALFAILGVFFYLDEAKKGKKDLASIEEERRTAIANEEINKKRDKLRTGLTFLENGQFSQCMGVLMELKDEDFELAREYYLRCETHQNIINRENEEARLKKLKEENDIRVAQIIQGCESKVSEGAIVIKSCLSEAIAENPENEQIQNLIDQAQHIDELKAEKARKSASYRRRTRAGNKVFSKAEKYYKDEDWKQAIKTFNLYLVKKYPDPSRKKRAKAKRTIASIKHHVESTVNKSVEEAQTFFEEEDFKEALLATKSGLEIEPDNKILLKIYRKSDSELNSKLKKLYQSSIIEEDLGDIQMAINKWKKIKNLGVEGQNYYEKASRKLKKYNSGEY